MKTIHRTLFRWSVPALALLCLTLTAACSDWLDVKPSTQIEKEDAEKTLI